MSTPKLFKVAYVRGVQNALVRAGAIGKYANEAMADLAAEVAADEIPLELAVAEEEVPEEVTGDVAAKLLELAEEEASKEAALLNRAQRAVAYAKRASDIGATGGGMDNPGNHLSQAAAITQEGSVEAQKRPESYANQRPAMEMHPAAQQGQQTMHPGAPTSTYVFDHSGNGKSASANVNLDGPTAAAILRKLAMGEMNPSDLKGATGGGVEAGQHVSELDHTAEGDAEGSKRPDGYANERPPVSEPSVQQGQEQSHPGAPTDLKLEGKVAADRAFEYLLRKTASEVGHFLPEGLSNHNKLAALRTMIGMTNEERGQYIRRLTKAAEEAAAEEEMAEEKAEEEKKDEAAVEEKEAAAATNILRQLGLGR